MLDVDLLLLVPREGEPGVSKNPRGEVRLELFAVEVLLRAVSRPEVVDERSDRDIFRREVSTVLYERSERCGSGNAIED